MSSVEPIDAAKVIALTSACTASVSPHQLRRTPWTWSSLTREHAVLLAGVVNSWVQFYNLVHALTRKELIPPCWPSHPGLAHELAVVTWTYHHAHHDPMTTPIAAAEYYTRYLPTFKTRLDHLLGRDPHECRDGNHPRSWRAEADQQLERYSPSAASAAAAAMAEYIEFS